MLCFRMVWCKDIGGEVYCIVCVKGEGLGGWFWYFSLWMTSNIVGGDGGPVMWDGLEMYVFVCVSGVVSLYGPENGESILALIGWICCLLHLYLWPWASIMYDFGVWAWPTMVPSRYDIWSAGLKNRTSCLGSRSSKCWALCVLL